MIHYNTCPVCGSSSLQKIFSAKDHTVSGKQFVMERCSACSFMFTNDVPPQQEIGAYYASENYISHSDTQKGLINRLYHLVRKRTLAGKRKLLQQQTGKTTGHVLDIGCGTGAFLNEMKMAGWQTAGLEPDDTARQNAQKLYGISPEPSHKIFELPHQSFDAVTMWHVLEHVHALHEYLAQVKKLLKPGGKFFVAVPNYTSFDAQHYKEHWAAYDVPRHLWHFSPKSMELLMSKHGLKLLNTKPMWFDSFYVSMLSEQYKNGKGNIVGALFTGLRSNLKAISNKDTCSSLIYTADLQTG
ncbi:MAG: class I SAM-dependent methyltransferase [Ferruginibacter sp.]